MNRVPNNGVHDSLANLAIMTPDVRSKTMKAVFMSIAVALTFCGCQTDQPPSDAQVLHCAPVFRQVGDNLTIRGFGPPITNTMPRTTLVLVDGANRVVVDFIGNRLPLILNTNTVYDFTVTPTRVSDQKMDLPSVFRVQKNGKTIYRYTDEMKKF